MSATLGPDPTIEPEPAPAVASATPRGPTEAVVTPPETVAERSAEVSLPATLAEPPDDVMRFAAAEPPSPPPISVTRRRFIGFGLTLLAGVAGAAVLGRLAPVFADETALPSPVVPTYDPSSKAWTFVVDTGRCIGCGLCVSACKAENHVPEEPQYNRTWVERHAVATDGTVFVDSPEAGIEGFPPTSTAPGAAEATITAAYFVPRLCMQCEASPCTTVCPVQATYRTADGIILVDADRCIGCGYCIAACPYGARYIVPSGEQTPQGTAGVADKCTWCYHRIGKGLLPACVEVCPVGARRFGDRNDPADPIHKVLAGTSPEVLYPEYGTRPRVLYLGPVTAEA
jgi:Fe-S-cluster-containing dehydrogenase component